MELGADAGFGTACRVQKAGPEEQNLRVAASARAECDPLALATGTMGRPRSFEVADREAVEVLVGLVVPRVLDVLADDRRRKIA